MNVSAASESAKVCAGDRTARVIEEHFVGHDGHFACGANFREFGGLARLDERAGGIVGMHDQHGARTRRERRAQRREIDLPAVVVE